MSPSMEQRLFGQHLEDDESVSRVVHKHWIIGFGELLWPGGLLLATLGGFLLMPGPVMTYVLLGALFCFALWFARNFFDYYLDAWIITDQGIIDLAWLGWFHRQSTRILYSDIQGVSYEVKGFWATLMRYGTIAVEKISTGASVSLPYVKKPKEVELLILRNMEAYLHSKNMKNATHVQDVLSQFVAEQVQLKTTRDALPRNKPDA